MLVVTVPSLIPLVTLSGAPYAVSCISGSLLTGEECLRAIRIYLSLCINKFRPHSYAIRGRATFFLNS